VTESSDRRLQSDEDDCGQGADGDDDDEFGDLELSYSIEEELIVQKCVELISHAASAVKYYLQSMSLYEDEIHEIDAVYSLVAKLRVLAVDVGAELYPPIDLAELSSKREILYITARDMIAIMRADPILSTTAIATNELDFASYFSSDIDI
jgi:hypothetical protein